MMSGQDDDGCEADNLAKFFGILRNFNYNQDIDISFKREIEEYFEYRWENDKSRFFNSTDSSDFMSQLPEGTVDDLMKKYLYKEFLEEYDKHWRIPKETGQLHSRYTWCDRSYRDLMVQMLNQLEPIKYSRHQIVFEELDEYSEVVFLVNSAKFDVGYSINKST